MSFNLYMGFRDQMVHFKEKILFFVKNQFLAISNENKQLLKNFEKKIFSIFFKIFLVSDDRISNYISTKYGILTSAM